MLLEHTTPNIQYLLGLVESEINAFESNMAKVKMGGAMTSEILLGNSNSLLLLDKNQWVEQLSLLEESPAAVLLTSWKQEHPPCFSEIESLVTKLINSGCRYFVCAGKYSESLHDFIDDVALNISLGCKDVDGCNVITTWHDKETDEEVAGFFLHSTNVSSGLLIAFLDEGDLDDRKLNESVLGLAEQTSG